MQAEKAQTVNNRVLYARDTDGCLPVHVLPRSNGNQYALHTLDGKVKTFTSKRQLLIALTGHPKARNWTFDRYFRLEPATSPNVVALSGVPTLTIMDLFGTSETKSKRSPISKDQARSMAKAMTNKAPRQDGLGIDLVNRSGEVAKLLFAGFGKWIYAYGYDPQEVLQEVFAGILVRNVGKCPWDARKSSFGHYVHLVCNGVVSNFHRKQKRLRECETTGIRGAYDEHGEWGSMVDVASSNLPAPTEGMVERRDILDATEDLLVYMPDQSSTYLARKVLPLLRDGHTRSDIAKLLGVSRSLVMDAVVELQSWASEWHMGSST